MPLFRASHVADNIYQLTGEALQRRGIRLLLADLDNTLVPYGVPLPDEKLKAWPGSPRPRLFSRPWSRWW